MVFSLSSKRKKNSKIPKPNSKVRVHTNSQRSVTVTNNLILPPQQSQNVPDPSVYQQLSSNRAIFESRKLESACSFLKCLKQKLEKDVDSDKGHQLFDNSTSETITDILDTLIDVSDNITPIISDVSASTKSIYRSTASDASSVSEKHFNKTMTATNKLLEFAKNPNRKTTNMADGNYYFAHQIVAHNLEELSMFKNNIKSVGDKIYVDKKLLSQLVELHGLLRDTITKLKDQENVLLTDPKVREELDRSGTYHTATSFQDTPKPRRLPETSTPASKLPPPFAPDDTDTSNDTGSQYFTVVPTPQPESKKRSWRRKSKALTQSPKAAPLILPPPSTNLQVEDPSTYVMTQAIPDRSAAEPSVYETARQTPTKISPEHSAYMTAREMNTQACAEPCLYATARQTPTKISPEPSSYATAEETSTKRFPESTLYMTAQQTLTKGTPDSSAYATAKETSTKRFPESTLYMTAQQTLTKRTPDTSLYATGLESPTRRIPESSSAQQTLTKRTPDSSLYTTGIESPTRRTPESSSAQQTLAKRTPESSSYATSQITPSKRCPDPSSCASGQQTPIKRTPESSSYATSQITPSKRCPDPSSCGSGQQTPSKRTPESSSYVASQQTPGKRCTGASSYESGQQTPVKRSPEIGAQTTDEETLAIPKLPFDISNISSRMSDDSALKAGKIKKKVLKTSQLEYATLLTAEVPSTFIDYDPSIKIKEEKISVESVLEGQNDTTLRLEPPPSSSKQLSPTLTREMSEQNEPLSPMSERVPDEDPTSTFCPSSAITRTEYTVSEWGVTRQCVDPVPEKTFIDAATEYSILNIKAASTDRGTEFSTSRLFSPVRKPPRQPRDTRDALTCCGGIKDVKTHGTSTKSDNSTNTSKSHRSRLFTSTPIPKETTIRETTTEISKDDPISMRNHKTQTPSRPYSWRQESFADGEKIKNKIHCKDCVPRKLFTSSETVIEAEGTNMSKSPGSTFGRPVANSTEVAERSPKKSDSYQLSDTFDNSSTFSKTLPGYFEGLKKCIAELECMKNCLRQATDNTDEVHECIQIYPETEAEYLLNSLPHFHTVMEGIPMVIQFNKEAIPIDNSLRYPGIRCCRKKCIGTAMDKASTCCREGVPEVKPFPCRLWGTMSKSAQESCPAWVSHKRRKSILKSVAGPDGSRRTNVDSTVTGFDGTRRTNVDSIVTGSGGTRRTNVDSTGAGPDGTRRTNVDSTVTGSGGTRRTNVDTRVTGSDGTRRTNVDTRVTGSGGTRRAGVYTTVRSCRDDVNSQCEKNCLKGKPPFDTNRNNREGSYPPKMTYISMTSGLADSSPSMPYLADKASLPKIDDPDKVCSSLQFDVGKVPVTFRDSVLYHPDGVINKGLKNINVQQLLDSFRPAKCCRKAVLNEKSHGPMPYSASLQSLPLVEGDLRTIKNIMQSIVPALYEKQTLYEHYINFQKNITPLHNKDTNVASEPAGRVYQVYFFEFLRREDEEKSSDPSSSRSGSNNTLHDLRIFDFIKKIYTSDHMYAKVPKKHAHQHASDDGDKQVKSVMKDKKPKKSKSHERRHDNRSKKNYETRPSPHCSKYNKTETKSYYSSVESYTSLKSNANYLLNSATSSLTSTTKYTRSRSNSNSTYSFLLVPKGEISVAASSNDLSTSYAPSVNSLPFEDELDNASSSSSCTIDLARRSSEEGEEWLLSPKNYAKTLDSIYELDEHGNMRVKASTNDRANNKKNITADIIVPFIQSRQEIPCNLRNLSTIYETDEKSVNKGSDANIFQVALSKSFSANRSKSVSPKSSVTRQTCSKSRIPIRIRSYSSSAICNERINNYLKPLPKPSTISDRPSVCSNKISGTPLTERSRLALRLKVSKIPLQPGSNLSTIDLYKKEHKQESHYVDAATSTCAVHKDFVTRVHPNGFSRQINTKPNLSVSHKDSAELQKALDGTSNFELPMTFEIVKPRNNADRRLRLERTVMSYDNESLGSTYSVKDRRNEVKCYRAENVNAWPQMQKKFETTNKALYVAAHKSRCDSLDHKNAGESQMQILQQHPSNKNTPHTTVAIPPTVPQNSRKPKQLTKENFRIIDIAPEHANKSILKRSSAYDKCKNSKTKKKVKHSNPEVIDIKISKDIKKTKLKHGLFKNGERPGYVTVLSTPCNCPDITIFLPCCCGCNEGRDIPKFPRQAQHYAMIPIVPKD